MPLLDHFRPPLRPRRHWHAFHNAWATFLAVDLNARLPVGYFAEPNVQFGIEIDVAAFEGPVLAPPTGWHGPAPALTVPLTVLTDLAEVQVFRDTEGAVLAGAIELISPSNKDRQTHRDAFVSKCASYLQQGVGLLLVDVVTERSANLHDALLDRVSSGTALWGVDLYAVAYRPAGQNGEGSMDVWPEELSLGQPLPSLPLWLHGGPGLTVDLDAIYRRTCHELRIS